MQSSSKGTVRSHPSAFLHQLWRKPQKTPFVKSNSTLSLFLLFNGVQLKMISVQSHMKWELEDTIRGLRVQVPPFTWKETAVRMEEPCPDHATSWSRAEYRFPDSSLGSCFLKCAIKHHFASECDSDKKERKTLIGLTEHLPAKHLACIISLIFTMILSC